MIDSPSWLVRVLNADGATAGSGIAVDSEHILTCAHLEAGQGGRTLREGDAVSVEFPFLELDDPEAPLASVIADVVFSRYIPNGTIDLAVLRLRVAAPTLQPPPMHLAHQFSGRKVQLRGFPYSNEELAPTADAELSNPSRRGGWVQISPSGPRGWVAERGFSGGPVWDVRVGAVIGMTVAKDSHHSGHMIAMPELCRFWPPLAALLTARPVSDADYRLHWWPRARGLTSIKEGTDQGWRFRGRANALQRIVDALNSPAFDRPIVVTGQPGAGKSAVLARIVTTAYQPRWAETLPPEDQGVRAELDLIDCAVHAKGKTPNEIAMEILLAAGVHSSEEIDNFPVLIAGALRDRRRFHVIIDALDEAVLGETGAHPDPVRQLVAGVVNPLTDLPNTVVILGTRAHTDRPVLPAFGSHFDLIDLDGDRYFDSDDLFAYVETTLRLDSRASGTYTYGDAIHSAPLARKIVAVSRQNFLVAGLVAHAHGFRDASPADPETIDFEGVDLAFENYLDSLPSQLGPEATSRQLLSVLALAESPGFTVELWSAAVEALDGIEIAPTRIAAFARSAAANFLIESDSSGGEPVFQLFHQALIDTGRNWRDRDTTGGIRACHARLAKCFTQIADRMGWEEAPEYLRRSLATHAAAGGELDRLLLRIDFLSNAHPATLAPALRTVNDERSERIAAAYRSGMDHHRDQPPGRARRQRLMLDLARADIDLPDIEDGSNCWKVRWCIGSNLDPAQIDIFSGHSEFVTRLAVGELYGRPVVLSAGRDCTVRMCHLATGSVLHVFRAGDIISAVSLGSWLDRPAVFAVDARGGVYVWDAETGRRITLVNFRAGFVAVAALGEFAGLPAVMLEGADHMVGVLDLETGAPFQVFHGHTDRLRDMAFGTFNRRTIVLTAAEDGTGRSWDLATGRPIGVYRGHTGEQTPSKTYNYVNAIALGELDGQPVVLTGGVDCTARLWNLHTSQELKTFSGHEKPLNSVAFGQLDGRTVGLTASFDRTARIWDLDSGRTLATLSGHIDGVQAIAWGTRDDDSIAVTAGNDRSVRVWDLNSALRLPPSNPRPALGSGLTTGEVRGRPVVFVSNDNDTIDALELGSGRPLTRVPDAIGSIKSLAFGRDEGRPVLVAAGRNRSGYKGWYLDEPDHPVAFVRELGPFWDGLTVGEVGGRLLSVVQHHSELVIHHLCDDRMARARGRFPDRGLGRYMDSAAIGSWNGLPIAIEVGRSKIATVWDLDGATLLTSLEGHAENLASASMGELHDQPIAVLGDQVGTVHVWNLVTSQKIFELHGHTSAVNASLVFEKHGRPVAVTGSSTPFSEMKIQINKDGTASETTYRTTETDYTVRFWDLDLGTEFDRLYFTGPIHGLALGPDGQLVVRYGAELAVLDPPT